MKTVVVIVIGIAIFLFAAPVFEKTAYKSCYSCDGNGTKVVSKTCTSCKGKGRVFCTAEKTWNYSWLAGGGSRTVTCDEGKFYDPKGWGTTVTCYACNGSRYHDCYKCNGYGKKETKKKCSNCGGDGEIRYKKKVTFVETL